MSVTLIIMWLSLALLGYLLVTAVLYTISTHVRANIALHERVRESRLMRLQYLQAVADRDGQAPAAGEDGAAEELGAV